jgi:signal transduction histidine kinase
MEGTTVVRAPDERDRMLAAATHDMLNALAGLTGYLELLEDEPASDRSMELQRRAGLVAARLTHLSEDLLVQAIAGADVRITQELVSVLEEVEACAVGFPRLEVTIDVDQGLVVAADRLRLHQILSNLVRNAQRYGRPPVHVTAQPSAEGTVRITVSDSGDGVPADFVPLLFDPHTRAPGTGLEGTGLGLSLARELTERQGGTLTYELAEHRFVLVLPTIPPSIPAAPQAETGPGPATLALETR